MKNIPFILKKDEIILQTIKPDEKLISYLSFSYSLPFSLIALIPVFILLTASIAEGLFGMFGFIVFFILPISFMLIRYVSISIAQKVYSQRMYWITNQRVICKTGFLGYKITSVPYNRISDVIISRSWLETKFNIASMNLQTLAGQISTGSGGSEASIAGILNPEELQEIILEIMSTSKF